ncbi:GNAT family N-acetyltransferase [Arthrobacter glacialis]|uniref:GNAT family N-acetyltransferase n=1 Tax=Arthrobacter glacialis TaxID=1664 RepID=UPI001A9CC51A|nr:GNAT family N-acetyltransferase [Arthrobacter glacialis]
MDVNGCQWMSMDVNGCQWMSMDVCGDLDMLCFMLKLADPAVTFHRSWVEAKGEWPDGHQDGSGIRPGDRFETTKDFEAWIKRLTMPADPAMLFSGVQVNTSRFWIVEHETYLGAIELRHVLTPIMLEAVGHIGYNIRPTARGRGIATWALKAILPHARSMGLTRVLLTCDEQNLPSARTIEKNGGVLEDIRSTEIGVKRRYWIDLSGYPCDQAGEESSRSGSNRA